MYEKNINIIMGNQIATSYVRKRDCYNQLKGFMQHEYPGKICALYGLRRTGKTVMMYQYISELSDKDKEKTADVENAENITFGIETNVEDQNHYVI